MTSQQHISFSVSADALAETRIRLGNILRESGVADEECENIVLAVDEAMTNIARHAYRGEPGTVDVEISVSTRNVVVVLLHSGEQFEGDVPTEDDVARAVNERRRGGYGLFLMKQNLDELEFGIRSTMAFIKLVKKRM